MTLRDSFDSPGYHSRMRKTSIELGGWPRQFLAKNSGTAGTVHLVEDGGLKLAASINIPRQEDGAVSAVVGIAFADEREFTRLELDGLIEAASSVEAANTPASTH